MTHYLEKKVREIAAKRPQHSAGITCRYVKDGKPSCIFGTALVELGKIDPSYGSGRTKGGSDLEGLGIHNVVGALGMRIPLQVLNWMCAVQRAQDSGVAWGEAVWMADRGEEVL